MKKKIYILLSAISLSFCMAGCSPHSDEVVHTHSFTEKKISNEYLKCSAKCISPSIYYYSCKCGECGTETFEYGTALGHSFTKYVSNNDATHSHDGTLTAKCDRCYVTDTKPDVGSKIPHTFNKKVIDNKYKKSDADCTHPAIYYYSCKCGECGTETFEYGGVLKHHYVHGICTRCSKSIIENTKNNLGRNNLLSLQNGTNLVAFYDHVYTEFQSIYENIPELLSAKEVNIDSYSITFEQACSIVNRVVYDQPLYYFVSNTYTYFDGKLFINFEKEYSTSGIREEKQKIIDSFLNDVETYISEDNFENVLMAHDLIINRIDYEYVNDEPSEEIHAHNILGVIEKEGAVCEGYAKTFELLCNTIGIPAYCVTGLANTIESHAWNLVQIEDKWYWCDLTWDDVNLHGCLEWYVENPLPSCFEYKYQYFLQSDQEFLNSHCPDNNTFSFERPYMYSLPQRSNDDYLTDHVTKLYSYIKVDDVYYQIIGFDEVTVAYIDVSGDYEICESIIFENLKYNVIAIGTYYTGNISLPVTTFGFNNQSIVAISNLVTSLKIPKTIKIILDSSLSSTAGINGVESYWQNHLESIDVDINNPYFCAVDGALYDKNINLLIAYPFERNSEIYTMPDTVVDTAFHALLGFSNLKEIHIGKSFYSIKIYSQYLGLNNGKITVSEENPYLYEQDGFIYCLWCIYDFIPKRQPATLLCASDVNRSTYTILDKIEKNNTIYYVDYFYSLGFSEWGDCVLYGVMDSTFSFLNNAKEIISYNELFTFDGYCLYYTDSVLYARKDIGDIVINPNSDTIYAHTFNYYDSFITVTLLEGIKTLGEGAFYMCHNLTTVYLPHTIEKIGAHVFVHDYKLSDIYFDGTIEEWGKIELDSQWLNNSVESVTIHCIDGDFVYYFEPIW